VSFCLVIPIFGKLNRKPMKKTTYEPIWLSILNPLLRKMDSGKTAFNKHSSLKDN
jgi:hypothetical protein